MTEPPPDSIRSALEEVAAQNVTPAGTPCGSLQAGDSIDRYRLLQEIGEGGMGSVWMAEQREPIQRKVALKIIKLGMDTKEVIGRFEAERQALALMDHPNIAKVLDGGATKSGRPYFVMELVRGVPITQYCDDRRLGLRERLELFAQVCGAIQHAHQKGIIHRDIKPSNVMVTMHDGTPVPKVIDFGIAKAMNAELTQRTMFTQYAQMIGTPEYMAPEQAEMSGLDIDTRADIYSLGVLLYELLTGTKPFEIERVLEKGYQELLRTIREDAPAKPSTRVSTLGGSASAIAMQRHVDAARLSNGLRGDLDWIVMKALEKDRTRRYESPIAFAADIRRHLEGEPVLAAPPSAAYRLRKFVGRRKKAVAAGATMVLLLLGGSLSTALGWMQAANANAALALEVAEKEAQRSLAVERREMAEHHAELALGSLQFVITDTLRELEARPGTEELRKALLHQLIERFEEIDVGLAGGMVGEAFPTLMAMKFKLATALRQHGESEMALELLNDVHEMAERRVEVKGETNAVRHNLAAVIEQLGTVLYEVDGDLQRCLSLKLRALELLPPPSNGPFLGEDGLPVCKDHAAHVANLHQSIGADLLRQGRLIEAREHFSLALDGRADMLEYIRSQPGFEELSSPEKDQKTYAVQLDYDSSQLALGYVQVRLGEAVGAMAQYEQAIASRRAFADRYPFEDRPQMAVLHEKLAGFQGLYGTTLLWLDRPAEAAPVLEESVALFERLRSLRTTDDFLRALALAYYRMGVLRDVQGAEAQARAAFEACRELRRDLERRDSSEKHRTLLMLALARCGDVQEARAIADQLGELEVENTDRHLDRARCYAQLVRHAEDENSANAFADLALLALRRAVEQGYQDSFRIRTENDLDPLHGRRRFEEIVTRVEEGIR